MEYVPTEMPVEMADLQLQCLITKGIERIFHMCKTVKKPWSKHGFYVVVIHPTRNPNIIYIYIPSGYLT